MLRGIRKQLKIICSHSYSAKREKRHPVLQSGTFNSQLPTSCPSWTALRIINYPLKYTVEVLSAGMRPREKGKLCDPATYKLLTPGLSPGHLPESSQKKPESNITFGLCLVTFTRAVTPGARCSPSFPYTRRRDGAARGEEG